MQQKLNWQNDYQTILNSLNPVQIDQFQADPESLLAQYGTSIGALTENMLSDEQALVRASSTSCLANPRPQMCPILRLWGVQLILNEPATKLTEQGSSGLSALTSTVAAGAAVIPALGSAFAAMAAIFASALQLQSEAIAFVDQGSGVHFNWTWAQLASLTVPALNAVLIGSMLVPSSNDS